ncbi:serine-rich adhesin for platelets-like [Protopterus annectens]|uniref:serine-rich adhesin for platelets-like n=1 Tax=Protopterus annectens TaxID=7888 RepID=UPI001CF9F38B|nr:serine-rich adhesin for platelets-like [Protopterus annectens]
MFPCHNTRSRKKINGSVAVNCHSPIPKAAKIKSRKERNKGIPILPYIGEESADVDSNVKRGNGGRSRSASSVRKQKSLASSSETDVATKSVAQLKHEEDTRHEVSYAKKFMYRVTRSKTSLESSASTSGITLSSSSLICSDLDAFAYYSSSSSTLDTCLSPEIFRGSESLGGSQQFNLMVVSRKNSTLLDVSTAKDLHMVPSPVNLSGIGDWTLENKNKQDALSEPVFKRQRSSLVPKAASVSVAGTTLHKIVHIQEKTPQQELSVDLSRKKGPEKKKITGKTSSDIKCRKRVNFSDPLDTETQSESTAPRVHFAAGVLNSSVKVASFSHCNATIAGKTSSDIKCRKRVNFSEPSDTEHRSESTPPRVHFAAGVLNSSVKVASFSHCNATIAGKTSSDIKCRKRVNFSDPSDTEHQSESTPPRVHFAAGVINSSVKVASFSHCNATVAGKTTSDIKCRKRVNFIDPSDTERQSQSTTPRVHFAAGVLNSSVKVASFSHCNATTVTDTDVLQTVSDAKPNICKNWNVKTSTPFRTWEHLMPDVSPVCTLTPEEELVPNITGVYVNSEEIIPASVVEENENTDLCQVNKNV